MNLLPLGILAATLLLPATRGAVPDQIHLAYGSDPSTSVVVSWATPRADGDVPVAEKTVTYATTASDLTTSAGLTRAASTVAQESISYDFKCADNAKASECDNPYASPMLHHTRLTGLSPRTRYFYVIGSDALPAAAEDVRQFWTAAPAGSTEPLTVAVIGDHGQTKYSRATVDAILGTLRDGTGAPRPQFDAAAATSDLNDAPPLFTVIVGDMSYADSYQPRWDSWFKMMAPLTEQVPLMVMPGNHEIEVEKYSNESFAAYRKRFRMPPGKQGAEVTSMYQGPWHNYGFNVQYEGGSAYYSYDVGLVHFISLNTYTSIDKARRRNADVGDGGGAQQAWLKADLAGVDRTKTPWIVVGMHAPWYHANGVHQDEVATLELWKWAEPLFVAHNVNLVLAGHVHAYERTTGILPCDEGKQRRRWPPCGTVDGSGPVYVTVGDGGNRERLYDVWNKGLDAPPLWSAFRDGSYYGYGRLRAQNATHLRWQWQPVVLQDDKTAKHGNAQDDTWIVRSANGHNCLTAPASCTEALRCPGKDGVVPCAKTTGVSVPIVIAGIGAVGIVALAGVALVARRRGYSFGFCQRAATSHPYGIHEEEGDGGELGVSLNKLDEEDENDSAGLAL